MYYLLYTYPKLRNLYEVEKNITSVIRIFEMQSTLLLKFAESALWKPPFTLLLEVRLVVANT